MAISRKRFFATMAGLSVGLITLVKGSREAAASHSTPNIERKKHKVVYHLNDVDKVKFVLGNIKNHFKGVGGPENADIVLVVHGPAHDAFLKDKANLDTKARVDGLLLDGTHLEMCGNTMHAKKSELPQLVDGFARRNEGGVVRITDLVMQGYTYLRP